MGTRGPLHSVGICGNFYIGLGFGLGFFRLRGFYSFGALVWIAGFACFFSCAREVNLVFSVSRMVPNGCMYTRVQTHVQTQSSPMLYPYKLFSEDLIPCLNPVSVFRPADDAAHEAKSGELSLCRTSIT